MSGQEITTYINPAIGPMPFCPGCGHHQLLKALDQALVKLQLDPKKVVIVTDIGCIGLSDRWFITSAFHGLHGRSITYACGLKLARPDLTVITLMGDGACGIGGTHFLNVARRNIGIKLLIGNNFNYGMTGGQHSVTTPTDGVTSTTPWGNAEGPMDLCGTAIAAGASWAYRTTSFEKDLADTIVEAIRQPGYALVDVWELCTAYYSPRNKFKKADLYSLVEGYGFKLGLLADKPRPEYSEKYNQSFAARPAGGKKTPRIETKFSNDVSKQTGIVIAGSAGQKVKSTASLLARAGMFAGLEATQKDDYPITVMTGHSLAEVILSPEKVEYTGISEPDYFILISEDGLKRARPRIAALPATCTLYTEETLEIPETKAKVVRLPLLQTAKKVGRLSIGVVGVAAMLADSGMFPMDAFETAISAFQKQKIAEINVLAARAGADLASQ